YGTFESSDLAQVLDAIDAHAKVGVIGVSYGAAIAIEWAGRDPRVAAVVAIAPFASLRRVVPSYARRLVPSVGPYLPGFLIDLAVTRGAMIAGFDPDAASAEDSAE